MSKTRLRVDYVDGKPDEIRFGRGLMGETTSRASMDGSTAIVMHDHAGSTDFEKELRRLPFVEDVLVPSREEEIA